MKPLLNVDQLAGMLKVPVSWVWLHCAPLPEPRPDPARPDLASIRPAWNADVARLWFGCDRRGIRLHSRASLIAESLGRDTSSVREVIRRLGLRAISEREQAEKQRIEATARRRALVPGGLPHVRIGRYIRFDPDDVQAWLRGQGSQGRSRES